MARCNFEPHGRAARSKGKLGRVDHREPRLFRRGFSDVRREPVPADPVRGHHATRRLYLGRGAALDRARDYRRHLRLGTGGDLLVFCRALARRGAVEALGAEAWTLDHPWHKRYRPGRALVRAPWSIGHLLWPPGTDDPNGGRNPCRVVRE